MTPDQSSSPTSSQTLSVEPLENIKKEVLRCGRIIFPDHKNEVSPTYDLPTFLSLFPPTKIVFPGCAWIQVHNPNRKRRIDEEDDKKDVDDHRQKDEENVDNDDQIQQEKDKGQSSHDVLVEFANFGQQRISAATKQKYRERLLASANDTYGKWMIFTDSQQVEAVWNAIATKVFHGELGCSAKVNNKKPAVRHSRTVTVSGDEQDVNGNGSGSGQHSKKKWYERKNDDDDDDEEEDDTYVICVYVDNFRNEEDVRRVLRVLLRTEGVTINAGFKPDFVTYLGLYSDKRMNPSCYHNAHKLGITTIFKEMLKEEKEILKKDLEDKKGEKDGVQQKHEIIELDNRD